MSDFPERAGLLAPGSMYESKTRVRFDAPRDLEAVQEDLEAQARALETDRRTLGRSEPALCPLQLTRGCGCAGRES